MDCIFVITFVNWVNRLSIWAIDGSGEVREEVVVREDTLNWREVSCTWRSFCLVSDVALSILSWAIIEWRVVVLRRIQMGWLVELGEELVADGPRKK